MSVARVCHWFFNYRFWFYLIQVEMNATNDSATNITGKLHTKCAIESASNTTKTLVIMGFALVLFSSLFGNSLLIRVVYGDKESRRKFPFNFLIINMAIADIMNASSASLVFMSFLTVGRLWISGIVGQLTCKITYFAVGFSVAASILTVVVMGLDRFMAAHATIRPLSKKGIQYAMALIWVLAGLFCIPYLYIFRIEQGTDGKCHCIRKWSKNPQKHLMILGIEEMAKFVVFYLLPLVLMVFCYTIITYRIYRRSELPVGKNTRSKIVQQNQRVVRMIIAIVAIFAFCWLPVHVNHLLRSFDPDSYCRLPAFLPLSFFWLAHVNCAINPWVWFMYSRHFRELLRKATIQCVANFWNDRSEQIPLTKRTTMKQLENLGAAENGGTW